MKKLIGLVTVTVIAMCIVGCAKKEEPATPVEEAAAVAESVEAPADAPVDHPAH